MKPHITSGLLCVLAAGAVPYAHADSMAGWNECHVGVNAGYGWADISGADNFGTIGSATAKGGAFGGQAGCDRQNGNWVLGAQLSANKANITGDHLYRDGTGPANRVTHDVKSLATLTVRIGYELQPDNLAYLKGGGAWTKTNHDDSDPAPLSGPPYTGNKEITRSGWIVGIGMEHKVGKNLSAFAEYNYLDFGSKAASISYTDGFTGDYSLEQDMDYLAFGVNYRF